MWIWREKKLIGIIIVVFLVLGVAYHFAVQPEPYASARVGFHFDNIHRGEYPDGSPFHKNHLIEEDVIEHALDELRDEAAGDTGDMEDLEAVSAAELRPYLEVQAEQPRGVREHHDEAVDPYHPNRFRLHLHPENPLTISREAEFSLLEQLLESYQANFRVKLGLAYPMPETYIEDAEALKRWDYPFIPMLIDEQAEILKDRAERFQAAAPNFQSGEQGYTFGDLVYQLESLQEQQLRNLRAMVREYHLTTSPLASLQRYQSLIEDLQRGAGEAEERAAFARGMLRDIEGEEGEDIPEDPEELEAFEGDAFGGEDLADGNLVEDLLRQDYFADLLERSLEAGTEAVHKHVDMAFYTELLSGIQDGNVPQDGEMDTLMARADEEIAGLMAELEYYRETLESMREEAIGAGDGAIQVAEPRERGTGRPLYQHVGLFGVLGVLVALFGAGLKVNARRAGWDNYLKQAARDLREDEAEEADTQETKAEEEPEQEREQ